MLARLVSGGSRHHHVVVSLGELDTVGHFMTEGGTKVHTLRLGSSSGLISGIPRLIRLIRREAPDMVQGWMNHGNLMAASVQPWSGGVPIAWNIRQTLAAGHCDKWKTRKLIRLNARLSKRPEVIIYNSFAGAEQHEAIGYAHDRRRIIPNGFDLGVFSPLGARRHLLRQKLGIGEGELLVGLIARFDPWKNHRAFFAAASQVVAAGHPVRFLLAGKGMESDNGRLMAMLKDAAVAERALLLGERLDIPELTGALDVACNVSLGEGFPNCVGEAMACAIPCVVTPVGDNCEIVGSTGVVCGGTSADDIAHGLLRLIDAGTDEMRRRGQAARDRIAERYSLPAIVADYDSLYDEVVPCSKATAA